MKSISRLELRRLRGCIRAAFNDDKKGPLFRASARTLSLKAAPVYLSIGEKLRQGDATKAS